MLCIEITNEIRIIRILTKNEVIYGCYGIHIWKGGQRHNRVLNYTLHIGGFIVDEPYLCHQLYLVDGLLKFCNRSGNKKNVNDFWVTQLFI